MNPKQQRQARIAQAKHRGTKQSHKTERENLLLILAWEAEILSEGQVSRIMGLDRVTLRTMRLDALDAATHLAEALSPASPEKTASPTARPASKIGSHSACSAGAPASQA